jgi:uncharacterized Zn-binding protein involved in type VI secretion
MGMPAARLGDMTAHGSPLSGGPCCPTVLIGGRPAWRGLNPAAAAALAQAVATAATRIAEAGAIAAATAGTPEGPLAQANWAKVAAEQVAMLTGMMASMGDMHACPIVKVVVPDGAGVVVSCSPTVIIGGQGAARQGDTIQECTAVGSVAAGEPTVLIG